MKDIGPRGKTYFRLVGELYLICAIDDHSRFIPYGQWFFRQYGINVYQVMYKAFIRYGLTEAILSDQGPQFKPTRRVGEANYQWYAQQLGIRPLYGQKPRTKGKIDVLFRFIQRDFVLENVQLRAIQEVNEAFLRWLDSYNFNHEHEGINKQCPADLYTESLCRLTGRNSSLSWCMKSLEEFSRRRPLPIKVIIIGFLMSISNAASGQS